MPPTANGAQYSPSVQFIRQATLRNEACRHKLPNGREQSKCAVSAARLPANAPCILRLPGEVSARTRSIGPSWPVLGARLGVKNVSRSGSARAAPGRARRVRAPTNKRRAAQVIGKPGRPFDLPVHPRSGRSEHSSDDGRST